MLSPQDINKTVFISSLLIGVLALSPFVFPSAYSEITVDWTAGGVDNVISSMPIDEGNLAFGTPVSVRVIDPDTEFNDAAVDTIDVLITSTLDPVGTILTLTETGPATDKFHGNTALYEGNFVISPMPPSKFSVSDIVLVRIVEEGTGCDTDDTVTQLDSTISGDFSGVFVMSDSSLEEPDFGVGLLLTETGPNTCVFEAELSFTDTGPSDESTATLLVAEGDIITFLDDFTFEVITNGQISPTIPGKGSILGEIEEPDANAAQVTATYLGVSSDLDLDVGSGSGGGGGGIVRTGLVFDSADLAPDDDSDDSDNGSGSGCSGDCLPPTLGVDSSLKRIVSNGFSYNENPVDVEQFYTPYPLITVQVGNPNTAILKIYDNGGTQNIAHVELGFGLGKDESFSENRAAVILDIARDGRESVTTFDPDNVLDDVSVVTKKEKCGNLVSAQCLVIIIYHTFREPLEFNMVGVLVWDHERNSWQFFFNHGVHIVGDSLNPPKTKLVAFGTKEMTGLFTLTRIDKIEDKWIDEFGNVYQHKGNDRFDQVQSIPSEVIEDYITMHGCDRMCNWFEKYKKNQELIAQSKMDGILGGSIQNNLPSFIPGPESTGVPRSENLELQNSISFENQKALKLFEEKYDVEQKFNFIHPKDAISLLKSIRDY